MDFFVFFGVFGVFVFFFDFFVFFGVFGVSCWKEMLSLGFGKAETLSNLRKNRFGFCEN